MSTKALTIFKFGQGEPLHSHAHQNMNFFIFFASFSYLSAGNGDGLIEDHFHGPGKEGPCQIVVSCFLETETNPSKRQAQQPHLSQKGLKKQYEYRICFTTGPRGDRAHPCRAPQKDAARPGGRLGLFESWNKCANIIIKRYNSGEKMCKYFT